MAEQEKVNPEKYNRDELDQLAVDAGLTDAKDYENKSAVADAINRARAGEDAAKVNAEAPRKKAAEAPQAPADQAAPAAGDQADLQARCRTGARRPGAIGIRRAFGVLAGHVAGTDCGR